MGDERWMETSLWMPTINAVNALRLDDLDHPIQPWESKSGGVWGRRGFAIDSHGIAWLTTGDGTYDPAKNEYANSIVGVELRAPRLCMKDYYTPTNWEWLLKRDLDPNNTPTIFIYKGHEIIAASGKECRLVLLDPDAPGGAQSSDPHVSLRPLLQRSGRFSGPRQLGSLVELGRWTGTRWVLAPFWGPAHSQFHFPITNTPKTEKGGLAAFKVVEKDGKFEAVPAWVSRDMDHGEPAIIANGIVFSYGSGDFTQQASPDKGLNFDSSIRARQANHVTLYALDAQTGKELYSSGDQITRSIISQAYRSRTDMFTSAPTMACSTVSG